MLRAVLNKYWWQHPTKQQLYDYLPYILQTIQVRRTRHAGHCWGSKNELMTGVLLSVLTDQQRLTFVSFVQTLNAV